MNPPTQINSNAFRMGIGVAALVSVGLVLLAGLPPFLAEGPRHIVMEIFSGVCHQLPNRSFHINDISLGVCHRCFGTYVGFPASVLVFASLKGAWPFKGRWAVLFLVMATVPAVLDWGGDIVGLWSNTAVSRTATGFLMGLVAGYYLTSSITDAISDAMADRTKRKARASKISG